jgi:uncharacterized cupredoxin-like copper-binding protein
VRFIKGEEIVRRLVSGALFALPVIVAVGCGGTGGGASAQPSGPTSVGATEKEFSISLAQNQIKPGDVTFNIANAGTIEHEFVVLKTDKPADQLPQASGEVDEDQLTAVDEVENIAAGSNETLSVNLPAGHYVVICNIPGHYAAGMHAELTVQ